MKKLCFVFLIAIALLLTGCIDDTICYWKFEHDPEDIVEIKIIDARGVVTYTIVKELNISTAPELYSDITNLEMRYYGYSLTNPFGLCFLIVFNDGNYDIIAQKEPKHYRYDGERMAAYNSWLYCDETEFNALIEKYMALAD